MRKTACNPPNIAPFVQTILAMPALLLAFAILTAAPTASAEDKEDEGLSVIDRQERIRIDVVRNLKSSGPHYNKTDRVSFKIKITNEDPKKEHKGLKAIYIIIAQNMSEKKRFTALAREEFKVDLGVGTGDREMEYESKEVTTNYDDYRGYESGEKYDGWALALINEENKIVAYKSSKESYSENIGNIGNIRQYSWFGLDLKEVEKPYNASIRTTTSP